MKLELHENEAILIQSEKETLKLQALGNGLIKITHLD